MNEQMQETRLRGKSDFPFERYVMRTGSQLIHVACHWQEDVELLSVSCGSVELMLDGTQHLLQSGDTVCITPCQLHALRGLTMDTAYDAYVFPLEHLLFLCEEQDQILYTRQLADRKLGFPFRLQNGSKPYQLVQEILCLDRERPVSHQLMIKAYLLQFIAALAQENAFVPMQPRRQGNLCREILSYIHHHYTEKCSVREVANAVGLSPTYFSAFFTHHFVQRYSDYLLNYRIEQASRLLLQSEQTITEIAHATGFGSSSHFVHQFRKCRGVTPLAYRNHQGTRPGWM